ncbi:MAG: magnesium transporter CorA family protein [Burkholderiales bacterium]
MRIFSIRNGDLLETSSLPVVPAATGYCWIAIERGELEARLTEVQAAMQRLAGIQLLELHVRDLLNDQLPSHYDFTSQYDVLVFRRLAAHGAGRRGGLTSAATTAPLSAPPRETKIEATGQAAAPASLLRQIDTNPVGFAVFDRILISVHPAGAALRDAFAARMLHAASAEGRPGAGRLAASPADLMLRMINMMVDGFLDLRRDLTRELDHWQTELLRPKSRAVNWNTMLEARLALHELDQICEDQHAAIQDWIDALDSWPKPATQAGERERDLLLVRSRDVLEHIERVVHHVRRLEQSAETAVQMHFSAQSNRTNDIMRMLTVLTAVFLPLNLIAGIFGMNFESIPLLHKADGFWIAMGSMLAIAFTLVVFFWRKRYLERTEK